jgi:hypothetical protein
MFRIVGYAYDAAVHCVSCTKEAHGREEFYVTLPRGTEDDFDMHDLPMQMEDQEGNEVTPVFSTDDGAEMQTCDDCHLLLM